MTLEGREQIEGRHTKPHGPGADVCLLVLRNRCGKSGRVGVEMSLERTGSGCGGSLQESG